jgi:anti-sigma regulatory factor (Ser/Thr protein kinase)
MDEDIRLSVRSEPRLLVSIRCLIRSWLERHAVEAERAGCIVLAVDEACSNAIRHAYEGRNDESVEVTLRSDSDCLEIVVCDLGRPCAKEKTAPRTLERPSPENVCPGGLGVQLIHQVFDEVEFRPGTTSGNCVTMRLKRPL